MNAILSTRQHGNAEKERGRNDGKEDAGRNKHGGRDIHTYTIYQTSN